METCVGGEREVEGHGAWRQACLPIDSEEHTDGHWKEAVLGNCSGFEAD